MREIIKNKFFFDAFPHQNNKKLRMARDRWELMLVANVKHHKAFMYKYEQGMNRGGEG